MRSREVRRHEVPAEDGGTGGNGGEMTAQIRLRGSRDDGRSNKTTVESRAAENQGKTTFLSTVRNSTKSRRVAFRQKFQRGANSRLSKSVFAAPPRQIRTKRGFGGFLRGQSEQRTRKQRGGRSLWQGSLRVCCIQGGGIDGGERGETQT